VTWGNDEMLEKLDVEMTMVQVRHVLDAHSAPLPAILEIPRSAFPPSSILHPIFHSL
jgi:hypothetical protein